MTPIDPTSDPIAASPAADSQSPTARSPFFDYADLFFFIALAIPSLFLAYAIVAGARFIVPISKPAQALLIQIVWYVLIFGALAVLFRIRYHKPLWSSLDWRGVAITTSLGALLAGPVLALALGLLGSALRAPDIQLPFEQMLESRSTLVLLGLLLVVLGPIAEELAFRGFLMPLLIRTLGAAGGVVLTGIIFGSLHGYEYKWSWQFMLLISIVGCLFGWAKYKTRSTVTSALMHATFNLTQFAALLAQGRSL